MSHQYRQRGVVAINDHLKGKKIYVDGELKDSIGPTSYHTLKDNILTIGAGWYGGITNYFKGALDDIRIYNRVLSEAEIQELCHEGGWTGLENGLIAYYPFNGNAYDSSDNHLDGVPNNATLTIDRFGNSNSAYLFNSDSISIHNFPSNYENITICAWIKADKTTNPGAYQEIFDTYYQVGKTPFRLHLWNDSLQFQYQTNSSSPIVVSTPFSDTTKWNFVCGSREKSGSNYIIKVWINGFEKNSYTSNEPVDMTGLHTATIGDIPPASPNRHYYYGKIDDVRIYSRALNGTEILELYYQGTTPCPGILKVDYEGMTYHTVQIGSQCWLKENLNVGTRINGSADQTNNSTIEKYCYNDIPESCDVYGGLYQWNEAMQYVTMEGSQGICPPGWHIPRYTEFQTCSTAVGGDGNTLKSIGEGSGAGAGTNTSGFSALLAGNHRPGAFDNLHKYASFWSSNGDMSYAYYLGLQNDNSIGFANFLTTNGFSVRCIKNSSPMDTAIINGTVFADSNASGIQDVNEPGLVGWKIRIKGITEDSTTSDALGNYTLVVRNSSSYTIKEDVQDGWVQTLPTGLGTYMINIIMNNVYNGKDFGNTPGFKYIGGSTGNWSQGTNWEGGNPPGASNYVTIPANVTLSVDALPNDSVQALRVGSNSQLNFSSATGRLKVAKIVQIDRDGTIRQPVDSDTTELICYGVWLNRGTIDPGHSKITFAGDKPKVIACESAENIFYNLWIKGDSTSASGNMTIKNQLILTKGITPRDQDTVLIDTSNIGAIQDTGIIQQGTIKRKIAPLETGIYRFESPSTYLKFIGEGTNPSAVSMTFYPSQSSGNLYWDSLGGTIDTLENTIKVDTIDKFSKWPFGIPRPKITSSPADSLYNHINQIGRSYIIKSEYGENYKAQISLRYDQNDIPETINETDLKLFRGPFYADSVQALWNMISLPLVPAKNDKDDLYPTGISSAFAYDGVYIEKSNINFGEGYWLKFSSAQQIVIEGEDRESIVIPVKDGWNLIGSISYPVDVSSISSFPPNIIMTSFFGYTKSYNLVDSLKPMFGYWVKVSSDGQLILSNSESGMFLKMASEKTNLANFNSLLISDANGAEQRLYFGKNSNVDQNRYELPPLPPEGIFDVRYGSDRLLEVPDKHNNREIPILVSSATYPIRLHWELVDDGGTYSLKISEKFIELHTNDSIKVDNPEVQISLYFSSHSVAEIPKEFQLSQNYPNPFNPSTQITYAIPKATDVTLKIYDILGQEVAVLVNERKLAGEYKVTWNASNVASGIYFYRLEATSLTDPIKSFIQVKKMLLVK